MTYCQQPLINARQTNESKEASGHCKIKLRKMLSPSETRRNAKLCSKLKNDSKESTSFIKLKLALKTNRRRKFQKFCCGRQQTRLLNKLAKIATQYTNVLMKIKECYNNCIKTAIAESDLKSKEIKKLKKEVGELKLKNEEITKDCEIKDKTVHEINKEILKLKKSKKESDK